MTREVLAEAILVLVEVVLSGVVLDEAALVFGLG
jgi:hypothetical protein